MVTERSSDQANAAGRNLVLFWPPHDMVTPATGSPRAAGVFTAGGRLDSTRLNGGHVDRRGDGDASEAVMVGFFEAEEEIGLQSFTRRRQQKVEMR